MKNALTEIIDSWLFLLIKMYLRTQFFLGCEESHCKFGFFLDLSLVIVWFQAWHWATVSVTVSGRAVFLEWVCSKGHNTRSPPDWGYFLFPFEKGSFFERSLGKHLVTLSISREKAGIYPFRQSLREVNTKNFLVPCKTKQTRKLKEENGRMSIKLWSLKDSGKVLGGKKCCTSVVGGRRIKKKYIRNKTCCCPAWLFKF